MRRNLFVRLLGLSLSVAVLAIAATAWLTTTGTTERLRGEFERTLEADSFVYQELLFYAQGNDSWDDVGTLVDDLAEQSGRRVALSSPDGEVLADSSDEQADQLPSTPTAEIDPSVPSMTVSSFGPATASGAAEMAWTSVPSSSWRLSEDEAQAREQLMQEATLCARQHDDSEVAVDSTGSVLFMDTAPMGTAGPVSGGKVVGGLTPERASAVEVGNCVPDELHQPSDASKQMNERRTELESACLDEAGVPYEKVTDPAGLPALVLNSEQTSPALQECLETARADAVEPFIADPALLYVGSTDRFDALSGDGAMRTALMGLGVLAAAAGVTVLAGRRLTHPIRTLTAAAEHVGSGKLGARVQVAGHDEVAKLGHAFNAMAESIESSERQRKALVGDVAHELRTPLANVRGYLEAAEDGVVPLDESLIDSLTEESLLLQRLIDDLQDLALADAGELRIHPETIDAAALARQVASGHRAAAERDGIALTVDAPDQLAVDADPARLRQALGNLVGNALKYTHEGGHVRVMASRTGDDVMFAVEDDGPGVASEHIPHLFDRFYRTDMSRTRATGGSGLGLAITRHLVSAHGGTVEVASTEGAGSVFTVRIPVRDHVADV